ncbi:hypothetical protein BGZ97_002785 [Linnemannia gamsii]|uniref:Uncharacterized protein n=1 Tax=Linnemannia gamsii TaxID=64522 RepID=A0A9P6UTW0_9FUNG|nr:hypothetical protein BGZ97_002785 [Linnemannia gamsii]
MALATGAAGGVILAAHLYFEPRLDRMQAISDKYKADIEVAAAKLALAEKEVASRAEIQYHDRIKVVKEKGDTIIKEVPVYVTPEDASHFGVNIGFVRSYNAAFSGEFTGSPTEFDREPARISLTELANVHAFNASVCRQWREQALGLREFYLQLQQLQ